MTPEEFISLLEVDKESIREVLRPQISPEILKFLVGGIFDDSKKRLVAYALMRVNKDYFWKYDYILNFSEGHTALLFNLKSDEIAPRGIYPPGKSLEEEIQDSRYQSNLISFSCEYDFNEWNILISNCFTDCKNKSQIIGSELNRLKSNIKNHFFGKSIFFETAEYYDKVMNHSKHFPKIDISPEMRPFIGHSYLVALIRCKKKREINEAYINYVEKAVFKPLKIN